MHTIIFVDDDYVCKIFFNDREDNLCNIWNKRALRDQIHEVGFRGHFVRYDILSNARTSLILRYTNIQFAILANKSEEIPILWI